MDPLLLTLERKAEDLEPKNIGGFWKVEKARKQIFSKNL